MKLIKRKNLLEVVDAVGEFDTKYHGEAPHTFANAILSSKKNKEVADKVIADKQKEVGDLDNTEASRNKHKVPSTEGMKKMKLSESLFEAYDEPNDYASDIPAVDLTDDDINFFDEESGDLYVFTDRLPDFEVGDRLNINFVGEDSASVQEYKILRTTRNGSEFVLEYIGGTMTEAKNPKQISCGKTLLKAQKQINAAQDEIALASAVEDAFSKNDVPEDYAQQVLANLKKKNYAQGIKYVYDIILAGQGLAVLDENCEPIFECDVCHCNPCKCKNSECMDEAKKDTYIVRHRDSEDAPWEDWETIHTNDINGTNLAEESAEKNAVAALLSDLIKDEFSTIQQYHDAIVSITSYHIDTNVLQILKDIAEEENIHVGQLQKALEQVSPDASAVEAGKQEAAEQLSGTGEG